MENLLVPYQAVPHFSCTHALVFAPHPDDEVFGCGGAIMRHVGQEIPVTVIIVTDGAFGLDTEESSAYILQRQQESIAAAEILGYGTPQFWKYSDRQVTYNEKFVQEILKTIQNSKADLIYAPSVFEMHPDHRAIGMAVVEAVRRMNKDTQIALYEIGMPMRPNRLLNITDLTERKAAAMSCFTSQNTRQRYDLHIATPATPGQACASSGKSSAYPPRRSSAQSTNWRRRTWCGSPPARPGGRGRPTSPGNACP